MCVLDTRGMGVHAGPVPPAVGLAQPDAGMDQYVRKSKELQHTDRIADHEIRITGPGKTRNYIAYATGLLTQKGYTAVEFKAMGQAINKTVTIAEIIKRRILGLHQNNQITSIAIQDTWEPVEEGLDSISVTRHVSVISITLSTLPLDENSPGYQPPLPPEMVKIHASMGQQPPRISGMPSQAEGSLMRMGYMPSVAALQALHGQRNAMPGGPASLHSIQSAAQQEQQQQQQGLQGKGAVDPQTGEYTVHFDGREHGQMQPNWQADLHSGLGAMQLPILDLGRGLPPAGLPTHHHQ